MPTNTRSGKVLQLTAPPVVRADTTMQMEEIEPKGAIEHECTVVISGNENTVTTLAPVPQYDFGAIISQLPGAVNINNLEVTLQQQQYFSVENNMQQMQALVGNTEQMMVALKEHVDKQFEQGNSSIRQLCGALAATFQELTSNHEQIFSAMQSFVSQFQQMHGDVTTNRSQLVLANNKVQQLQGAVQVVQGAGNTLEARVEALGGQLRKVEEWAASQEVEMCLKSAKHTEDLNSTLEYLQRKVEDLRVQVISMRRSSSEVIEDANARAAYLQMDELAGKLKEEQAKVQVLEQKVKQLEGKQGGNTEQLAQAVTEKFTDIVEGKVAAATKALEKKIQAVVGATHKSSKRFTVVGLASRLDYVARRNREIETLQGQTKICSTVRNLASLPSPDEADENGTDDDNASQPPSPNSTQPVDPTPTQPLTVVATQQVAETQHAADSEEGDTPESAQQILDRQVCLANAQAAAKQVKQNRAKQVIQPPTAPPRQVNQRATTPPATQAARSASKTPPPAPAQPAQGTQQAAGWNVVTTRKRKTPPPPDKSCWIYVSNYIDRHTGLKGYWSTDRDDMRNLRGELGALAHHLVGCVKVSHNKQDRRLLINAPDKTARRQLLRAIKQLRNKVRASVFLSATEKQNKKLVYRQLKGCNVYIEDQGDRCLVTQYDGTKNIGTVVVTLEDSQDSIRKSLSSIRPKFPPHIQQPQPAHRRHYPPNHHQPPRRPPNVPQNYHHGRRQAPYNPHTNRYPRFPPNPAQRQPQLPVQQPQYPVQPHNPLKTAPTYLSELEVMQLRQLLSQSVHTHTYPPTTNPQATVNLPASAQLAWALGVHPTMHRQGPGVYK